MKKIILLVFFIAGCETTNNVSNNIPNNIYGGTYRFDGPGEFSDFANSRYQCAQETMTRRSSSSAAVMNNSNVGIGNGAAASSSTAMPSCSMFNACLAAKGFFRNPNGKFDASSIGVKCFPD